jgi:beta-glucosidase-like glycosyl hydrolase
MVNDYQSYALTTRLQIPLIDGIDSVHGHGNAYGATVFPHNIGLGATRDPALAERVGHATAAETRATGIPWVFAPCVCVTRDERWGRSYESFGEDAALVRRMESILEGSQGPRQSDLDDLDRVLATAKHYAGDGDTEYDQAVADANAGLPWWEQKYPIDQGVTVTNRADFDRVDLAPYRTAIGDYHVGSVMPSFSSVDWTEDGVGNPIKMHANQQLISDVLKGRLGFTGLVVSDWEGIHQIPDPNEPTNAGLTGYKVRVGVNAGTDMFMEPNTAAQFEQLLLGEVDTGRVAMARIDDAVARILLKKFQLGLSAGRCPFARSDQPGLVAQYHRLHPVAQVELGEDPLYVGLDRRLLHDEGGGDLGVGQSPGHEGQHLALAGRELTQALLCGRIGPRLPCHPVDDAAGDRRREQRLTGGHRVDRGDELLRPGPLEQEAGGAGGQRAEHVVVVLERGEDQHRRTRRCRGDRAGRGDPVEAGHADVHQHDVGPHLPAARDRLVAVGGLGHNLDAVVGGKDRPQAGPHQVVVVAEQDPQRCHVAMPRGRCACNGKTPSCGPASNAPPSSIARSRMPITP